MHFIKSYENSSKNTPDDIRNLEFETIGSLQKQHAPYFHRLLTSLTSASGDNSNTILKEASRNKEVMLTFSIAHLLHTYKESKPSARAYRIFPRLHWD